MSRPRRVDDPAELEEFFGDAAPVHVYALVDLEEPYWSASTWWRRDDAVVGFVGLPDTGAMTIYAVSTRAPGPTLDLLGDLADRIPPDTLLTGPTGLGPVLRPRHDVVWCEPHVRYRLPRGTTVPDPDVDIVDLGRADLAELVELYGSDPGAAFFTPAMLDDDTFVGVTDGGRLVAAAGTHVLSERKGVAAIGAVFTRRTHRGRGFGRAVTAAVANRLRGRVDVIGLNVAADNVAARRVYEGLGFVAVHDYDEALIAP